MLAGDTRDRIISMYKTEIKKHGERERDFQHLESMIADLDRRSRLLDLSINEMKKSHDDTLQQQ